MMIIIIQIYIYLFEEAISLFNYALFKYVVRYVLFESQIFIDIFKKTVIKNDFAWSVMHIHCLKVCEGCTSWPLKSEL